MTICTYLVTRTIQMDIKLFLGQAFFIVKTGAKNEAF